MSRIISLSKIMIVLLITFLISSCTTSNPTLLLTDTPTATIVSSPAATARPTIAPQPSRTPTSTPLPEPTLKPPIDPLKLPSLLTSSITLASLDGISDRPLKRISGWDYGVRTSGSFVGCQEPYQWLGSAYLLIYPVTGEDVSIIGTYENAFPVVVSLDDAKVWLSSVSEAVRDCGPLWSASLQRLINVQGKEVLLFDTSGNVVQKYSFNGRGYLSLAPSGLRLLAGAIWIDLPSGLTVNMEGQNDYWMYSPAWSSDEMHLFDCCFNYMDVQSGRYISFTLGQLSPLGRDFLFSSEFLRSVWVQNDSRVVIQYDFDDGNQFGVTPLIDPILKSYQNIRKPARLSPVLECSAPSIAPEGSYLLIHCAPNSSASIQNSNTIAQNLFGAFDLWAAHKGPLFVTRSISATAYLISLNNFRTKIVPNDLGFINWSPNGNYLLLSSEIKDWSLHWGKYQLLAANEGVPFSISTGSIIAPTWSSDGKRLAYLSEDSSNLVILNVATRATTQISFPQSSTRIFWRPQGDGLAIQSSDGSLWYTPYPFTDRVEQLTPPLPKVEAVKWSPDGDRIAFVSEPDVYIVSVTQH